MKALRAHVDLDCCRRHLVERAWDLEHAEEGLKATIAWRAERRPEEEALAFSACGGAVRGAQSLRCVGLDVEGRPVLYECFQDSTSRLDAEARGGLRGAPSSLS